MLMFRSDSGLRTCELGTVFDGFSVFPRVVGGTGIARVFFVVGAGTFLLVDWAVVVQIEAFGSAILGF